MDELTPKIFGLETEYANVILHSKANQNRAPDLSASEFEAARLVRDHALGIEAEARRQHRGSEWGHSYTANDFGLKNGARLYIDHAKVEMAIPECLDFLEGIAAVRAADSVVNRARIAAQQTLDSGEKLFVARNNTTGSDQTSWGGHVDLLMNRAAYTSMLQVKSHMLHSLWYPWVVSSIILLGAGKPGHAPGTRPATYQLSARADHFSTLTGAQTMFDRPLCNLRDEPHADAAFARFHIIAPDTSQGHQFVLGQKIGQCQLIGLVLEDQLLTGRRYIHDLTLEDAVEAFHNVSRDLSLRRPVRLVAGGTITPLEMQEAILDGVLAFIDATPQIETLVPHAHQIAHDWGQMLDKLKDWQGNLAYLMKRLDWVSKWVLFNQYAPGDWSASMAELKELDFRYASVADDSLFAQFFAGASVRLIEEAQMLRAMTEPPTSTRAYLRTMVQRKFQTDDVHWDKVVFRTSSGREWYPRSCFKTLRLTDPTRGFQAEAQPLLDAISTPEELIDAAIEAGIAAPFDAGQTNGLTTNHPAPSTATGPHIKGNGSVHQDPSLTTL